MTKLAAIAAGGALGALARHAMHQGFERWLGPELPWGTVAANALGCFLLGLLAEGFAHQPWSPAAQALLTTGFLGAFTTFSTFSVQTVRLLERGDHAWAAAHVLGSVAIGLALAGLGVALARRALGA